MTLQCLAGVVNCVHLDGEREIVRVLDAANATYRSFSRYGRTWFGVGSKLPNANGVISQLQLNGRQRLIARVGDGLPIDPDLGLDWLAHDCCVEATTDRYGFSRRFVVAGWDEDAQAFLLARDPLGMEPVYYGQLPGGGLVVASRALALLRVPGVSREPDIETCAEGLLNIPRRAGATFLRDIKELPRATLLRLDSSGLHLSRYFRFGEPKREEGRSNHQLMASGLESSIRKALRRSERPAATLSGGLDSTSVFRVAHGVTDGNIAALSAVFPNDVLADERSYLDCAVQGTDCIPVSFEPTDFVSLLDSLPEVDDPQGIALSSITVACAKKARQLGLDQIVTGQFGDFVGGRMPNPVGWLSAHGLWSRAMLASRELGGGRAKQLMRLGWSGILLPRPVLGWEIAQRSAHFRNATAWLSLISPRLRTKFNLVSRLRDDWIACASPRIEFSAQAEYFFDHKTRRVCAATWWAERLSSIRIDHPFADVPLARLSATLNFDERWAAGRSRATLRRAMDGIIPPAVQNRRTKADLAKHHCRYFLELERQIPEIECFSPLDELLELRMPTDRSGYWPSSWHFDHTQAFARAAAAWLRMVLCAGATNVF